MRNTWIDFLKGIAIIAIVLFHADRLQFGYLGVDIFFVISGFFVTKGLLRNMENGSYGYWNFLLKRLVRLYPLILIAGFVSLAVGYFFMLPNDLKILAESIIASNFFVNNILASITTKDYWDIAQQYKPLMHTWYIGILLQFYVMFPLVLGLIARKKSLNLKKCTNWILIILTTLSAVLYFSSSNDASRFYFLQYRMFELTAGGLVALNIDKLRNINELLQHKLWVVWLLLVLMMSSFSILFPKIILLPIIVALSCLALCYEPLGERENPIMCIVAKLGMASYSIYIWHQVVLAFYRYIIDASLKTGGLVTCLLITGIAATISYLGVEKHLKTDTSKQRIMVFAYSAVTLILTSSVSAGLYIKGGVVRDIPELNLTVENAHRGMFLKYVDRIYKLNKDFTNDGRIKVLIIGDSYGRDFANVLLESNLKDKLDISYIFFTYAWPMELSKEYIPRLLSADYVFVRGPKAKASPLIFETVEDHTKLWGIGTKSYGRNNGNVYSRRFNADYHNIIAVPNPIYIEYYDQEVQDWGDHYVDFMNPVSCLDGKVKVFTDDEKYISQDCRHLTQAGAKYYAKILDLERIFKATSNN